MRDSTYSCCFAHFMRDSAYCSCFFCFFVLSSFSWCRRCRAFSTDEREETGEKALSRVSYRLERKGADAQTCSRRDGTLWTKALSRVIRRNKEERRCRAVQISTNQRTKALSRIGM